MKFEFHELHFRQRPVNINTGNFVHEREELPIDWKTKISFR